MRSAIKTFHILLAGVLRIQPALILTLTVALEAQACNPTTKADCPPFEGEECLRSQEYLYYCPGCGEAYRCMWDNGNFVWTGPFGNCACIDEYGRDTLCDTGAKDRGP